MGNIKVDAIIVGDIGTNCYVFYDADTNQGAIVDPGADADRICEFVERLNVKPEAILLTHGHFDHIMACDEVASHFGVKVYVYKDEKKMLEDEGLNLSSMYGGCVAHSDVSLNDGDVIYIAGQKVKVIHTPGHTSGGCCYYLEEAKMLFCGDTLFMESVGRTDFPTGSMSEIVRSVNEKLFCLPEDVKAFPGHGPSTSIGYEKVNNPYASGLF